MNMLKTLLITGAAHRLGRHTALHLAAQGWDIALHYHHSGEKAARTVDNITALGRKAIAIEGDLSKPESPQHIVQRATEALGPLGALVNNAARFERDTLHTLHADDFYAHMAVNLYAPLQLTAAFASQLPTSTHGAVVNLIDGCETLCLSPKFLSYSLSKYGLANATRLLAQELAPRIRVNGVSPGLTLPNHDETAMFERLVEKLPLKRTTSADEIAHAVAYLLETPSITGQILALDGGASLLRSN